LSSADLFFKPNNFLPIFFFSGFSFFSRKNSGIRLIVHLMDYPCIFIMEIDLVKNSFKKSLFFAFFHWKNIKILQLETNNIA